MRVQHAEWLTPAGEFKRGDLWVVDGNWSAPLGAAAYAGESFDATGLVALPGLIDAHVHLREPGLVHKEGIDNGTRAALRGGVTTILEMPNTVPPCSTPEALREKRALYAEKSRVHWGLHYQATFPMEAAPENLGQIASAKIYMAKSSTDEALCSEEGLRAVFSAYPRVAIHAEDEGKFCPAVVAEPGSEAARSGRVHHLRRPVEAITAALGKIERVWKSLPERTRPRIVLCHVATREELAWVKRMRSEGFDIWAETCPHYVLLTQDDYVRVGNDLKVNPPLRTSLDREAIALGLENGDVDFISTDHAPHTPEEKRDVDKAPSGIAAIECLAPLLLTLASRGVFSLARLHQLTVDNPAACYGLKKRGAIAPGNTADIVFLKPGPARARLPLTKAQVFPFLDFDFAYEVHATWVAGKASMVGETFLESGRSASEVYP